MYTAKYRSADVAFRMLYAYIMSRGIKENNTLAVHDVLIEIENPVDNIISTPWRKWNSDYAEFEWQWYLSGDNNAAKIAERAKIWLNMMDDQGCVNSNYGYQWKRNGQLDKVINMLNEDPTTRRASISLYDGKEIDNYKKDTVCTYAINFYISDGKLNMQVMMRSNDLVFGFCNDQYCFSKLQMLVAEKTGTTVGTYSHYVCNLHIYERHFNLAIKQRAHNYMLLKGALDEDKKQTNEQH